MRVSRNNERFRPRRGKLRRPLLRVVISFDKASPVGRNRVFQANPLSHFDTTIVEGKLAFSGMIGQKSDMSDLCGIYRHIQLPGVHDAGSGLGSIVTQEGEDVIGIMPDRIAIENSGHIAGGQDGHTLSRPTRG